jgi:predicted Rdx family selenoprotein
MSQVTIKRCPTCSSILGHTQEVVAALKRGIGVQVKVQDGVVGEFAILVDGVPVIQRTSETLPSIDEVEAAVENAAITR